MIRCKALGITSLFFIVVTLGVASRAAADDKKLQDLIDRGSAALKKEDYPAAKRRSRARPRSTWARFPRGAVWLGVLGARRAGSPIKVSNEALAFVRTTPAFCSRSPLQPEERQRSADALAKYAHVLEAEPGHLPAHGSPRILVAPKVAARPRAISTRWSPRTCELRSAAHVAQVRKDTGREDESRRSFEKLAKQRPEPRLLRSLSSRTPGDLRIRRCGEGGRVLSPESCSCSREIAPRFSASRTLYADLHQSREASARLRLPPGQGSGTREDARGAGWTRGLWRRARQGDRAPPTYFVKKHPNKVKFKSTSRRPTSREGAPTMPRRSRARS